MLPARHRFPLRKHPDFFSQARKFNSDHFLAYVQPASLFAAAIIIPQKALTQTTAPAVVRHQIKRWLTELLSQQALTKPFSVVIVVKPRSETVAFPDWEKEVSEFVAKL